MSEDRLCCPTRPALGGVAARGRCLAVALGILLTGSACAVPEVPAPDASSAWDEVWESQVGSGSGTAATPSSGSGTAASTSSAAGAGPVATTTTSARPQIVVVRQPVRRPVPFRTRRTEEPSLEAGTQRVVSRGEAGTEERVYRVRKVDGKVVGRTLVRRVVVVAPRPRVIAVGTRRGSSCDRNYSGCVPISSDVDCAGGGGNGPAYLDDAVRIIGEDIYDLDRDGDGWACEDD